MQTDVVGFRKANVVRTEYVDIIEYTKRMMKNEVEKLVQNGCDVNEQDICGDYAVVHAARINSIEILKLLVNANARLDVTNSGGFTPLLYAEKNQNQTMIDFIRKNRVPQ